MQGEDLGPLELKIDTLQKQISDSVERCADMQGHWLRQQNELVRKTREAEEETAAVDSLRKQQLILQQKKMRIDGSQPPPPPHTHKHTHTLVHNVHVDFVNRMYSTDTLYTTVFLLKLLSLNITN